MCASIVFWWSYHPVAESWKLTSERLNLDKTSKPISKQDWLNLKIHKINKKLCVSGSPAIDYPNDYYNDAEYYNDAYGSYNSSDENYIDVDAQVKVVLQITQERFLYLLKKMNFK